MTLADFVIRHTERGECKCGKCSDVGTKPDPQRPHTVDMVFFKVAPVGEPSLSEFRDLTASHVGEFNTVNPFDGREHNYMELGGWIGDQGLAMQYMALGVSLGAFKLLTPHTLMGLSDGDPLAMQMAGSGFVAVQASEAAK